MGGDLGHVLGVSLGVALDFLDIMQQREDRRATVWHTIIRPGQEMELRHRPFHSLRQIEERGERGERGEMGERGRGDGGEGEGIWGGGKTE